MRPLFITDQHPPLWAGTLAKHFKDGKKLRGESDKYYGEQRRTRQDFACVTQFSPIQAVAKAEDSKHHGNRQEGTHWNEVASKLRWPRSDKSESHRAQKSKNN